MVEHKFCHPESFFSFSFSFPPIQLFTFSFFWNTRETTMQRSIYMVDSVMFIIALEITIFVLRGLLM